MPLVKTFEYVTFAQLSVISDEFLKNYSILLNRGGEKLKHS